MITSWNIISGNYDDLQNFKKNFFGHDCKTLEQYFKIATNKNSVMIVRKTSSRDRFMQVVIVPFKNTENNEMLRKILNRGFFHFRGVIRAIQSSPSELFVFGKYIPKNTEGGFEKAIIQNKKVNPFKTQIMEETNNEELN